MYDYIKNSKIVFDGEIGISFLPLYSLHFFIFTLMIRIQL